MADQVVISGKSREEIAHQMAIQILMGVEGKQLKDLSRKDYLQAHYDSLSVLNFNQPK